MQDTELQSIKNKLLELEGVYKVESLCINSNKYDFLVFTSYEFHSLQYDFLWSQAQDVVINEEWKKRDETNSSWYFDVQVVIK